MSDPVISLTKKTPKVTDRQRLDSLKLLRKLHQQKRKLAQQMQDLETEICGMNAVVEHLGVEHGIPYIEGTDSYTAVYTCNGILVATTKVRRVK